MKIRKKYFGVLISLIAVLLGITACSKTDADAQGKDSSDSAKKSEAEEIQEKQGIEFPYEMEDGKLVVNSLFQSSIENPDCNQEMGEDVASVEITNQSDVFCASVEVTAIMSDGTEIPFSATNIPAGKTIWAFASDNASIGQDAVCAKIKSTAVFREPSLMEDQLSVEVNDTVITIQNLTQNEITDLTVCCHCLFEEVYFGGLTYNYPVESIPAGESVTVEAVDCYMGTAEVVGIVQNNQN